MEKIQQLKDSLLTGEVLLFDKPYKWTSFDVISKIKSLLRYKLDIKKIKIGHAGTLDPLATGLLIICTGKKTKTIQEFQNMEKEYEGTFHLGATTPSFDLETQLDKEYTTEHITEKMIEKAVEKLTGKLEQLPPLYSAKKINGKRAYLYARKGKSDTPIEPNTIYISKFQIKKTALPDIDFNVVCSKGTYIRSLARDFGFALGSGAYLKNLRRTRIGEYQINNAISIEEFEKMITQ